MVFCLRSAPCVPPVEGEADPQAAEGGQRFPSQEVRPQGLSLGSSPPPTAAAAVPWVAAATCSSGRLQQQAAANLI